MLKHYPLFLTLSLALFTILFTCNSPNSMRVSAYYTPSPFVKSDSTSLITFILTVDVPGASTATDLEIFVFISDLNGNTVWTKHTTFVQAQGMALTAGSTNTINTISWGGENDFGQSVSPGLYVAEFYLEGKPGGNVDYYKLQISVL